MNNSRTIQLLNEQITHELSSAYLYLAMSMYCDTHGFPGAAHWLRKQFSEEQTHGEKIIKFLSDIDATPMLNAIEKPQAAWTSIKDVFTDVLNHEKLVTRLINAIKESSISEKNYAVSNFTEWYISEQVEEEADAKQILDMIIAADGNTAALMMLDAQLGSRKD